jgi:hypothetical protein
MNYNPSTIARIGDIKNGLLIQTSKEISYLSWGVGVQASLFTVYNRIAIHALWCEVGATTLVGAGALMLFNFASSVPVVAAAALNAVCTTIHGFVRGRRISLAGTTIGTATSVDSTAGISIGPTTPVIVGIAPSVAVDPSVGQIGCLTSIAVLTAGTAQFSLLYTPIDAGAYAQALL